MDYHPSGYESLISIGQHPLFCGMNKSKYNDRIITGHRTSKKDPFAFSTSDISSFIYVFNKTVNKLSGIIINCNKIGLMRTVLVGETCIQWEKDVKTNIRVPIKTNKNILRP